MAYLTSICDKSHHLPDARVVGSNWAYWLRIYHIIGSPMIDAHLNRRGAFFLHIGGWTSSVSREPYRCAVHGSHVLARGAVRREGLSQCTSRALRIRHRAQPQHRKSSHIAL